VHAQIVLFDGFDPLDVIAPFDVLVAGSDAVGGELVVELVSAEGPGPVVSGSRGLVLNATAQLDPSKPGYVIVPGASGPIDGDPDEVDTIPVLLARFGETKAVPLMRDAMANPDSRAAVCDLGREHLGRGTRRHARVRGDGAIRANGRRLPVRHPPDDPVEDPQACAGRGHYAAFAATGAILPTTSVVCSSA
jgi:hypothetical protein